MNYRASGASTPSKGRRRAVHPTDDFTTASFLARLARMSPQARLLAYRDSFTARQRTIWIAHYPDEVPIVNGEFEHIALALADLDVGGD